MFLEKLELFGFKSFAERTQIRFSPGITAVVGPNGCGKSNISDAVRWALGEQNVRTLRGRTLQDVIFKGTREVKPMGMAEVALHLDNESQRLATEYAQVAIRRRAFRSGESEFSINKAPCRLKDIRGLFMDTGLGSAAYAVIEREMIDEVLADRDQARRFLLDEASGITRYKQRRHETLLKLEAVERDLTRVDDALEIEEREVRSLAYQMGKTRRHRRLSDQIRDLEIALARLEWRELSTAASGESGRRDAEGRQREAARARVRGLEAEQESLRVDLLGLAKALEGARGELSEVEERLAASREEAVARAERIRSLTERIDGLADRIRATAERRRVAEEEREGLRPRLEQLAADREQKERVAAAAEREWREAERVLQAAKEELGRHQQLHIDCVRRHSDAEHRISASEDRRTDLEAQGDKIAQQISGLDERATELDQWIRAAQSRHEEMKAAAARAGQARAALAEELRRAGARIGELDAEAAEPLRERTRAESRLALLEEQARSYEGYGEGVARLLSAKGEVPGVLGAASELLEIDPEWSPRLAPLLHEFTGWVVTVDEAGAWRAIAWLRERQLGQVTFFPLDTFRQSALATDGGDGAGGAPLPAEAIRSRQSEADALAQYVRERCIPVRDAAAVPPVAERSSGCRWVTEAGEIFAAEGWFGLGGGAAAEERLWDRPQEIDALQERIAELNARYTELQQERAAVVARVGELEPRIASEREEAEARRLELESLSGALLQKEAEARLVGEEIARLRAEDERLGIRRLALTRELQVLEQDRVQVQEEGSSTEARFRAASESVEQLSAEKDQVGERLSEKKMAALVAETQMRDLRGQMEQRAREIATATAELEAMEVERRRAGEEITESQQRREELQLTEAQLLEVREARRAAVDRRDRERSRLEDRLAEIEGGLREQRRALSGFEEALRENEVRLARIEAGKENLQRRVAEQYAIDLAQLEANLSATGTTGGDAAGARSEGGAGGAEEAARPLSPEEVLGELSPQDARTRVETLRGDRDRLGPVNPLAIEEYEKKKEHVRFIQEQRDDLLKSKDSLHEAIDRINREARQLFQGTFDQVQENLTQTFETLFPGGEAQLRLSGDDPLEADIEIMARPRGKRLESIHLLSSGEKALTATALLFALYLVKPSPFCLLDEVDAPLDDANIDRFLNLLRNFSARTQFVLITHNKRTMEVADSLYGVTMQEPGISKIVSVHLEGETIVAQDGEGRTAPLEEPPPARGEA